MSCRLTGGYVGAHTANINVWPSRTASKGGIDDGMAMVKVLDSKGLEEEGGLKAEQRPLEP